MNEEDMKIVHTVHFDPHDRRGNERMTQNIHKREQWDIKCPKCGGLLFYELIATSGIKLTLYLICHKPKTSMERHRFKIEFSMD